MRHIDKVAETALVETLIEHELEFTLISEESGTKRFGSKPICYVTADPIDGTTNTLRGIPFACTSIAISRIPRLDAVEAAIVADLFNDIVYSAQRGVGVYRNSKAISPAQTTSLTEALLGFNLNTYKLAEPLTKLDPLLSQTGHVRHLGANALELCYVADGTIDAFIDVRGRLRTTDSAAAIFMIQEAGGTVTTITNTRLTNPLSPTEKAAFIAAGNPSLHRNILRTLSNG